MTVCWLNGRYVLYAAQLLFFLIGTYLPTFSSVIRHVMGLHDKFEVDRRLKSLHGLRSHIIWREMVVVSNGGKKMTQNVCRHITSKRIELESPGWSGLIRF